MIILCRIATFETAEKGEKVRHPFSKLANSFRTLRIKISFIRLAGLVIRAMGFQLLCYLVGNKEKSFLTVIILPNSISKLYVNRVLSKYSKSFR